jgi:hypothetical protein
MKKLRVLKDFPYNKWLVQIRMRMRTEVMMIDKKSWPEEEVVVKLRISL